MDILSRILKAETRIRPYILKTPLVRSIYLSKLCGGNVYLKMESEQYTGSFKARGSLNKLMAITEKDKKQFAITASTGNHGLGFARGLKILNMEGKIVLPENASASKIEALKAYGSELEFYGQDSYEAEMYAKRQAQKNGYTWVSPYNDEDVIGGQGTIAIEISSQLPRIDNVFVTIGGGGLVSGIATYLKKVNPEIHIIGCQPENSPEMYLSVKAGKYQTYEKKETLSDGSAGGFENDSITFDICRKLIDDYYLISEDEIKEAIRLMIQQHGKLIEGAAGVAVAGFLKGSKRFHNQNTVIVVCGSNISVSTLKNIL